jgi:Protein of unknown function (DUF2950)
MKRELIDMINLQKLSGRARAAMVPFAMLIMWATNGANSCQAQQPSPPTFPSAAEAGQNLFQAVQHNDERTITSILGGPTDLSTSRDPGQDRLDRELFVQRYQEMHRLGREPDGSMTLYIGAENWPFPIPLVENKGAWHFDSEAGSKEVLFRQIGDNEFAAIAMCHDFVAAEKQYRAQPANAPLLDSSPTSLAAKAASGSAGGDPVLFHGYYFKLLERDNGGKTLGGFAFIAYPAEYRSTGVMTFIITKNGVVSEKDLGANTSALAKAMTTFHKDATWVAAEQ